MKQSFSPNSIAASSQLHISRYEEVPRACLEDEIKMSVDFLDICQSPNGGCESRPVNFSDNFRLQAYMKDTSSQDFSIRFIFLKQANSWNPLRVTRSTWDTLMEEYKIMPEFLELAGCFSDRDDDQTEEGFVCPVRSRHSLSTYEICYGYKYVEKKSTAHGNPWRIRQSGIYHRQDLITGQSVIIVLSPVTKSMFEQRIRELAGSISGQTAVVENPMLIHHALISTHLPDFQGYLKYLETELEPVWKTATTSYLEEPLRVNYDSLSKVRYLESRILPIEPILIGVEGIIHSLEDMSNALLKDDNEKDAMTLVLKSSMRNLERETCSRRQYALFLIQRTHSVGRVISDILNFKNQAMTQDQGRYMSDQNQFMLEQNKYMARVADSTHDDSVNVRVITFVSLFYLPFSFIATLLGMNLVIFDTNTRHLVVSTQLWIYFAIATPLTGCTFLFYKCLTSRHNKTRRVRMRGEGRGEKDIV